MENLLVISAAILRLGARSQGADVTTDIGCSTSRRAASLDAGCLRWRRPPRTPHKAGLR
jgi:hypothetical protein